jgi:hypothetical protein
MKFKEMTESSHKCPHCGGPMFSEMMMMEKKDACYYKVKASAKVWPSAYASGRLVQCRKKGAGNYGNKSEGVAEGVRDLGYDAQSLIMKLRRDVEEKRLQPTRQAVLSAARELAGDMDFAPELLVRQVLGQGVAEDQEKRGRGRPPANDQRQEPVQAGRVEKTATGMRHHADPSRYGGTEPEHELDT